MNKEIPNQQPPEAVSGFDVQQLASGLLLAESVRSAETPHLGFEPAGPPEFDPGGVTGKLSTKDLHPGHKASIAAVYEGIFPASGAPEQKLTAVEPSATESDEAKKRIVQEKELLESVGFVGDRFALVDEKLQTLKGPKVVDVSYMDGAPVFTLEFNVAEDDGTTTPELGNMSIQQLLNYTRDSDKRMLSGKRPRPNDADKAHKDLLNEEGARKREDLRASLNNGGETGKAVPASDRQPDQQLLAEQKVGRGRRLGRWLRSKGLLALTPEEGFNERQKREVGPLSPAMGYGPVGANKIPQASRTLGRTRESERSTSVMTPAEIANAAADDAKQAEKRINRGEHQAEKSRAV